MLLLLIKPHMCVSSCGESDKFTIPRCPSSYPSCGTSPTGWGRAERGSGFRFEPRPGTFYLETIGGNPKPRKRSTNQHSIPEIVTHGCTAVICYIPAMRSQFGNSRKNTLTISKPCVQLVMRSRTVMTISYPIFSDLLTFSDLFLTRPPLSHIQSFDHQKNKK